MLVDPEADEAVIRRVEDSIKEKAAGITTKDKQVKSLSVAGRAKYFNERIQDMERVEAARYLQEQIERKVLTPKVEAMMLDMESFKNFFSK
jgi:phosphoenolpyruvate-protein kinase (PTS system EI component)